jgi:carbon monoxide dehydrogenase subunit G
MAVRVEKTFQVQEPVEQVWALLSDPQKVVTCVPGAHITEQLDDRNYKGAISVKVGPSVTDFKGAVEIVRIDPDAHEIEILGKGQDVRGKGSASMKMTGKLRALENGTEVNSVSELNVVGILAQMGGRMINEVSNIMFEQFTRCFREQLQGNGAAEPPTSKPIRAMGLAFSALKASMRRGEKSGAEADKETDKTEKEADTEDKETT